MQAKILAAVALTMSLFAIYVNGFINIQEIYRNVIFLGFIFILGFFLYPATKRGNKKSITIMEGILLAAGLSGVIYILLNYSVIHNVRMSQAITIDYIFAIITIVVLLEIARRSIGIFIPMLSLIALVYAVYGPHFPGVFGHAGFSIERLLFRVYMTTEGLF